MESVGMASTSIGVHRPEPIAPLPHRSLYASASDTSMRSCQTSALHMFSDAITRSIFAEVARVVRRSSKAWT